MTPTRPDAPPASRDQIIDLYFMEHRAKLLDIAAFLDRVDRAGDGEDDARLAAFRSAVAVLTEASPGRAERIHLVFSDPTVEPIAAAGMKGAIGAHDPSRGA